MDTTLAIAYFSMLVSVLALIFGIFNSKHLDKALGCLLLLVFVATLTDISSYVLAIKGVNNFAIINAYSVVELLLYLVAYSLILGLKENKVLFGSVFSLVCLSLIVEFIWGDFMSVASNVLMVASSFGILFMSLVWFYKGLRDMKYENILLQPFFWVSSSSLIYFASNLFIFLFSNYIFAISVITLWNIHNVLHIIYFLLISVAFWTQRHHQK